MTNLGRVLVGAAMLRPYKKTANVAGGTPPLRNVLISLVVVAACRDAEKAAAGLPFATLRKDRNPNGRLILQRVWLKAR